jgi:hypothetical protein
MKKFLKWLGVVLGVLLGVIVIALAVFYVKGNAMPNRKFTIALRKHHHPHRRGLHCTRQAFCAGDLRRLPYG